MIALPAHPLAHVLASTCAVGERVRVRDRYGFEDFGHVVREDYENESWDHEWFVDVEIAGEVVTVPIEEVHPARAYLRQEDSFAPFCFTREVIGRAA